MYGYTYRRALMGRTPQHNTHDGDQSREQSGEPTHNSHLSDVDLQLLKDIKINKKLRRVQSSVDGAMDQRSFVLPRNTYATISSSQREDLEGEERVISSLSLAENRVGNRIDHQSGEDCKIKRADTSMEMQPWRKRDMETMENVI
ncbi:hypothetical protein KQX54_004484 [Cotesia glomerata]|uniref:Uncharacterized protein n=1 Tax=Cotesia glomerata TaxID=32391 RepID=A0AAV7J628_COTGL|nr:hypothetical protein KQX54_004484 [Cotesia glomerata]